MELKIDNILLPTDFSVRSADAARHASVLARRFHSKLTLLHVFDTHHAAYRTARGGAADSFRAELRARLEEMLESFLAGELKDFEVTRVLAEGDPAQTIVEYARCNRVDMIVSETRGTGVFRRLILGSVTAKVLHDAPCPVLTGVHAEEARTDERWEIRHILCAVDPACGDEAAIDWAAGLSAAFGAKLSVVHAIPAPPFHLQTHAIEAELRILLGRDARERIARMLEAGKGPPDTEIHVQSGPVGKVVLAAAQDFYADLVVIGHGSAEELPGRLHTNGYAIIRDAPCPVLSV
jgi:nucleotide-binding universal stress UspA family protein